MGSGQSTREVAWARKAVAMSGSTRPWSPVISMTITRAVMGVCTTPVK